MTQKHINDFLGTCYLSRGCEMTEKIVNLRSDKIGWRALLHQTLEREGVEAVVVAVRIEGRWHTAWSNEAMAGLAMAAMKLNRDVSDFLAEDDA